MDKKKKNLATFVHKGVEFSIWQDEKDNWTFTCGKLEAVNTQHKELQPALNEVYDSIDATLFRYQKARVPKKKPKQFSPTGFRHQYD